MLRKWVVCGALACAASSASAANWVVLDRQPDITKSVDLSTVVVNGIYRKVWVRSDYTNGLKMPGGQNIGQIFLRYTLRCSDREYASGQLIAYDRGGQMVHSEDGDPNKFEEAVPGSFGEAMLISQCK
jgi:hypothetical protein